MTFEVQIGEPMQSVELRRENGGWAVLRDGQRVAADVAAIDARTLSLLLEGRSYTVRYERLERAPGSATLWLGFGGGQALAEVRDPRRVVARRQFHQTGRVPLKAPMAGKVVRVLVEAGATVEAGAPILVLEAMKMQNEVRSPKAGTVAGINVRTGDTVATGQLLAEVE